MRSKNQNFIDTIDSCLTNGARNGVFHLTTEDEYLDGKKITINGKILTSFGSCSYLGLEVDERLKNGVIEAVKNHGTQFSSSRLFIQNKLYLEAEDLLGQIFKNPSLLSPTTSLGHMAALPVLVQDEDLVIIDHQVHGSVQNAVNLLKSRRIWVEMIKHNDLEELENLIVENRTKFERIWYMMDGVYSMYGDYAPIHEVRQLLNKYHQFWVYADDAHGMSWTGTHGCGYLLGEVELHERMIVATSLNKAFACCGGALIFPNEELKRRVRTCGSAFTFSGPIQPPMLGAIVASAKLHMTDEFDIRVEKYADLRKKTLKLIEELELPLVRPSDSPIFYIAMGLPRSGYNIARKLMEKGFYVDIGIFPGVPVKCAGIRVAINAHHSIEDITLLLDEIKLLYPIVLEEEGQTIADISQYFNTQFKDPFGIKLPIQSKFVVEHQNSISKIDKVEWDSLVGDNGSFDYEGCKFLEDSFSGNETKENNWRFHYFIIKDKKGRVVVATFITELIVKDDMLSPYSVSEAIELERTKNKYYLSSKVLMMGSMMSAGEHFYIDRNNHNWKEAFRFLLHLIDREKHSCGAEGVYLRDFDTSDEEITTLLIEEGFIKADMPASYILPDAINWNYKNLVYKKRYHIRKFCIAGLDKFEIETINSFEEHDLAEIYKLYENVKRKSLTLNTFDLPLKLFINLIKSPYWDVFCLRMRENNKMVSVLFNYVSEKNYCPMLVGMDYDYVVSHGVYRKTLYQSILRAKEQEKDKVYLGMLAPLEKRKFGSDMHRKSAFVQLDDTYKAELISQIAAT